MKGMVMWTKQEKALLIGAALLLVGVGMVLKAAQKPDESHTPILENTAHEGISLSGRAP
jgi:hypothetical protein